MGEQSISSAPSSVQPTLDTHLRVPNDHSDPSMMYLSEIKALLSAGGLDAETSVELMKSYEERHGQPEDLSSRLSKFLGFVKSFQGDGKGMLDTIKNLGYLSKNLLEEHAKETGDWGPFLRRVEADRKRAANEKASRI